MENSLNLSTQIFTNKKLELVFIQFIPPQNVHLIHSKWITDHPKTLILGTKHKLS